MTEQPPAGQGDRGAASAPTIVALGLLTVALVTAVNLAAWLYGHSAMRSAADQAARAGARADATAATCEQRATQAVDAFLGGPLATSITTSCADDGEQVRASVTATFHGWLQIIPDRTVTVTATAAKEHTP